MEIVLYCVTSFLSFVSIFATYICGIQGNIFSTRQRKISSSRVASVPAPSTQYFLSLLPTWEIIVCFYERSKWELIDTDRHWTRWWLTWRNWLVICGIPQLWVFSILSADFTMVWIFKVQILPHFVLKPYVCRCRYPTSERISFGGIVGCLVGWVSKTSHKNKKPENFHRYLLWHHDCPRRPRRHHCPSPPCPPPPTQDQG